jgi:hypothetical protein
MQSQAGQGGDGVCPWIGHQNEEKIKEEILTLSSVSVCKSILSQKKNTVKIEIKFSIARIVEISLERHQPAVILNSTMVYHIQLPKLLWLKIQL